MRAEGLAPDREACICLVHTASALGLGTRALFFFREASRFGKPSMRTCMTLLRVFKNSPHWEGAIGFLEDMKAAGTAPDALALNCVLGICVSAAQLQAAEGVLRRWEDIADVISCNILLKGYAQQADLPGAEALLQRMLRRGPEPNVFNTLLDCAVREIRARRSSSGKRSGNGVHSSTCSSSGGSGGGDGAAGLARRPWELLELLEQRGLQPDRYTCSTLVKGLHFAGCSGVELDRAVALLRRLGPEGLQVPAQCTGKGGPSLASRAGVQECNNTRLLEVLFNTLLDACAGLQDLDRMARVFAMMEEFGVSISAVTLGTLIKAFGQAGRLGHCREVVQRMQSMGVAPTVVTYGCYIDACVRAGDICQAEEAFHSMKEAGVQPNAVVYTSLIRGFSQANQPSRALELYRTMQQDKVEATAMTFNTVLNVLAAQVSDPELLSDVVDTMRKAGIMPDAVTYSILIKAGCNAGRLDGALASLRELRGSSLTADGVAFNTLLLACSRAERISDAEEVFAEMRSSGVVPTHVTTSILVKMYGRAKMLDRAVEVSEQMERECGRRPNLHVYTCLIQACVQNNQVRRSWELFNKMLRAGIQPDAITYGTMIQGCICSNKLEVAMDLVRHAYLLPLPREAPLNCGSAPLALGELEMQKPVPLQPKVLRLLLMALRRKTLSALASELEAVTLALGENCPRVPVAGHGRQGPLP